MEWSPSWRMVSIFELLNTLNRKIVQKVCYHQAIRCSLFFPKKKKEEAPTLDRTGYPQIGEPGYYSALQVGWLFANAKFKFTQAWIKALTDKVMKLTGVVLWSMVEWVWILLMLLVNQLAIHCYSTNLGHGKVLIRLPMLCGFCLLKLNSAMILYIIKIIPHNISNPPNNNGKYPTRDLSFVHTNYGHVGIQIAIFGKLLGRGWLGCPCLCGFCLLKLKNRPELLIRTIPYLFFFLYMLI